MNLAENDWLWAAWTQLWQVTVLIVAVALLMRCVARNRPQLAFVLWLVVFLKCVTPPLWSSPSGAFCWLQLPQTTLANTSQGTLAVIVLPSDAATISSHSDSGFPLTGSDGQTCHWDLELLHPVALLTIIWGVGIVAAIAAIAVQWRRAAKLIRPADVDTSAPYAAMLASLARRLRIHQRVRLVVTEHPVGPAVLGLIRSTILLPRAVIDGKSADEIELILAHELMHVRRGDLWLALLRSLVLSLWWFHPLVWWAARRASREAERCCDDAVLAELRYSPARYARCLLDILEIKHRLSPVPAFSGVHAIEVNQGRLERIMKIGQSGYRRTPWWCWGVAFLAAFAVLPGAAIHTSADEGAADPKPTTSPASPTQNFDPYAAPDDSQPAAPAIGAGVSPISDKDKSPLIFIVYSANDVLYGLREERGLSGSEARECLSELLKSRVDGPVRSPNQRLELGRLAWRKNGEDMVIGASQAGHKQVAEILDGFRKYGTAEIEVRVLFVALRAEEFQKMLPDWTMSPLDVDEATLANPGAVQPAAFDRPLGNHEGTCVARAQLVVEKDSPVRFRIVDKELGEKLIDRCQADARTNILQAPKVTVFNGQTAFVSDTSQSPFVVGVIPVVGDFATAQQPQIRVVSEGTTLQFRPVADRSGAVHLDFAATLSKIQEVETVCFNRTPTSGTTIQIPKMATVRMEGGAVLKPGQWLLLGGSNAEDQSVKAEPVPASWTDWLLGGGKRFKQCETQELVMMLRAEKIQLPRATTSHVLPPAERD